MRVDCDSGSVRACGNRVLIEALSDAFGLGLARLHDNAVRVVREGDMDLTRGLRQATGLDGDLFATSLVELDVREN